MSDRRREEMLQRAVLMIATGEDPEFADVFCEDVVGRSHSFLVTSRAELRDAVMEMSQRISNVAVDMTVTAAGVNMAVAEWHVEADRTARLPIGDQRNLEAPGRRMELSGVTIAEFRGENICAFRSYFGNGVTSERSSFEG